MTFTEPASNDDVFILIPIRSAKKSEPNRDPVVAEKRKIDRSKSIMDMQKAMVEKAKETRNVSFSGVSAMVDAVLRFSSITVKDQDKKLVNAAIENNKRMQSRVLERRRDLTDVVTVNLGWKHARWIIHACVQIQFPA